MKPENPHSNKTHVNGVPINTLMPMQDGHNFADNNFKWIFLNEDIWIAINISLKLVPTGKINNIPA